MGIRYGRTDRRTKINEKISKKYPYKQYETEPIWAVINKGISDLVENGDIEEKTARQYIVGYLCKVILESKERKPSS